MGMVDDGTKCPGCKYSQPTKENLQKCKECTDKIIKLIKENKK